MVLEFLVWLKGISVTGLLAFRGASNFKSHEVEPALTHRFNPYVYGLINKVNPSIVQGHHPGGARSLHG